MALKTFEINCLTIDPIEDWAIVCEMFVEGIRCFPGFEVDAARNPVLGPFTKAAEVYRTVVVILISIHNFARET